MHELMQKEKTFSLIAMIFLNKICSFSKATLDIRCYQSLLKESKMVYRLFSGVGIPRIISMKLYHLKKFFCWGF